jgi:type IV pilus assembly protein PilE
LKRVDMHQPGTSARSAGIPSALRASAGFTTVELLVALAIAGVISSLAYPSFSQQLGKSRRADGIVALTAAQMAQERWRANQSVYGTLADIGVASVSSAGYYTLHVPTHTATSYEILATARGLQGGDSDCRNLRLAVVGGNFAYASGPDAAVANPPVLNRRCWSL